MILKVEYDSNKKDWLFISNIKEVRKEESIKYKLVINVDDTYGDRIRVCALIEDADGIKRINRNVSHAVDKFLFDTENFVNGQNLFNEDTEDLKKNEVEEIEKVDDRYWSVTMLHIKFEDETNKTYASLNTQAVYLLNDNGQTIEKLK